MTLRELEEALVTRIGNKVTKMKEIKDFNEDTLYCDDPNIFFGHYKDMGDEIFSIFYSDSEPEFIVTTVDKDGENIGYYEQLVDKIDAVNDIYTAKDLEKAVDITMKVINEIM